MQRGQDALLRVFVPGTTMVRNIPGYEDPQQRVLALTFPSPEGDVRVVCAYCPNGQSVGSDKYAYKLEWFEAMRKWLAEEIKQFPRLAVLGDYNVAPEDRDVHDPAAWEGEVHVSPRERAAFQALLDVGLADAYASLRIEVGSAYTIVFFLMIVPLLIALQIAGGRAKTP